MICNINIRIFFVAITARRRSPTNFPNNTRSGWTGAFTANSIRANSNSCPNTCFSEEDISYSNALSLIAERTMSSIILDTSNSNNTPSSSSCGTAPARIQRPARIVDDLVVVVDGAQARRAEGRPVRDPGFDRARRHGRGL